MCLCVCVCVEIAVSCSSCAGILAVYLPSDASTLALYLHSTSTLGTCLRCFKHGYENVHVQQKDVGDIINHVFTCHYYSLN